jgi:hypothetical protein
VKFRLGFVFNFAVLKDPEVLSPSKETASWIRMGGRGEPSAGADVGRGEPSAGADVAGASPVPVQMWQGRCEPSPGADVAGQATKSTSLGFQFQSY